MNSWSWRYDTRGDVMKTKRVRRSDFYWARIGNRLWWVKWSRDRWRHATVSRHNSAVMQHTCMILRPPIPGCLNNTVFLHGSNSWEGVMYGGVAIHGSQQRKDYALRSYIVATHAACLLYGYGCKRRHVVRSPRKTTHRYMDTKPCGYVPQSAGLFASRTEDAGGSKSFSSRAPIGLWRYAVYG